MEFKPDWKKTRQRFVEFWEGRNEERALIAAGAYNERFDPSYYHENLSIDRFSDDDAVSIKHWWCDAGENVKRFEYLCKTRHYAGETLPIAFTNWGAMALCSFMGCDPVFKKTDVWYRKTIHDWDDWRWEFDETGNEFYKSTMEITAAFAEMGAGRYFAGMPELGGAGDVLSLMRGMDDLCLDLYDNPEPLRAAIDYLTGQFLAVQETLYEIIKPTNDGGGTLPWMSLWMPGKNGNQVACDFSSVISNDSFEQFFTEAVATEADWSDYAVYHLDGPACMKNHLDWLLGFDDLKAIEWTPGAGCLPATAREYFPAYRKILDRGKRLVIQVMPEEVDTITKELPPDGLFLTTWARTSEEADNCVKTAAANAKLHRRGVFA